MRRVGSHKQVVYIRMDEASFGVTRRAQAVPLRCLWVAVTAAQGEFSLAPWLGLAEQHAYGSMPAAFVDKVFKHLHAA